MLSLSFTPVDLTEHSVMELADWGLCVCVCVRHTSLSHGYCMCPEAMERDETDGRHGVSTGPDNTSASIYC